MLLGSFICIYRYVCAVYCLILLQELEAIKARVREMEEEAEKIRQMQNEVEKQMNRSTSSTLSKCSVLIINFER